MTQDAPADGEPTASTPEPDPELTARRAEALASPVRWRLLRLCLHHARTNAELSELLGLNPGTVLRHVRLLTETGFLAAQEERRGRQGAREIPYLATRLTWQEHPGAVGPVLVHTLLDEIAALEPRELEVSRLGVRLTPDDLAEIRDRLHAVIVDAAARDSDDPAAQPWSLMTFMHPDRAAGLPAAE